MKATLYILFICTCSMYSLTSSGQSLRNKAEVKGNDITYKIKYSKGFQDYEVLIIENVNNKLSKQKIVLSERAKSLFADPSLLLVDWKMIKKLVANAIPTDKLLAKKSQSLTVFFYFNDEGLLKEVAFGVNPDINLDSKDLERVENTLVNKIQGKVKYDAYRGTNYIQLADSYPFEMLLKVKNQ